MPTTGRASVRPPRSNWRTIYGKFLEGLVITLMIVLFLEVTIGVIFRTLGHALSWYDEVASVLLAWLTFYGSALASFKRAHIGCPEIIQDLSEKWRRPLSIFAQLIVIAFFVTLCFVGLDIMPVLATDTMTSLPNIPMNIVQSVIPISCVFILVCEIDELIRIIRRQPIRTPSDH
jgi:TRAP-type C4-dicarboxylate transport system permease small subunit